MTMPATPRDAEIAFVPPRDYRSSILCFERTFKTVRLELTGS
jgi:hypothetical protein